MRNFLVALALAAAPLCASAAEGTYSNSWDANRPVSFNHTLEAATGGPHTLSLEAQSSASGGLTVAVYRAGPDGRRITGWRLFVIATTHGNSATGVLHFPNPPRVETGGTDTPPPARVPVVVVVENASGRQHTGSYTLSIID